MAMMNTTQQPKFKRLRKRLGIGVAQTLGHLECLWQYTHSTGNPVYTVADAEAAAEWEGEDGALVAALSENSPNGWLDKRDDGLYEVHDYWENCPQSVRDRVNKRNQRNGKTAGHVPDVSGKNGKTAGHVPDMSGQNAENGRTCPGHGGQEKKRKEVDVEKNEDPPLPPTGEPAAVGQDTAPTSKPKRKPASKQEFVHPEYEACCAELPALWNAVADVAGLDRSPDPMTKSLRRQVQLLMAESDLFCQNWRELPKAFAACRWSTSRHVGISVALRTRWGNKPGVPFEDKYMAMLSAQQRGETTNAGGWTRDSDREF